MVLEIGTLKKIIQFVPDKLVKINRNVDKIILVPENVDKTYNYLTKLTSATTNEVGVAKGTMVRFIRF